MPTISLDDDQRKLAIELHQSLSNDEIQSPDDFLDTWKTPDYSVRFSEIDGSLDLYEDYVSPEDIKGPAGQDTQRLEPGKLMNKLKWMVEGDFEEERMYPPMLQKRGEDYYVTNDGLHRCLAAKALDLDRLYVEYEEIPEEALG